MKSFRHVGFFATQGRTLRMSRRKKSAWATQLLHHGVRQLLLAPARPAYSAGTGRIRGPEGGHLGGGKTLMGIFYK
jgi:hypothetical protein